MGTQFLFRLIAIFFLMLAGIMPRAAYAAQDGGDRLLSSPCLLTGARDTSPTTLMANPQHFNCAADPRRIEADTVWIRYDLSRSPLEARAGWTYDHATHQARDERVWAMLDNGRLIPSPTSREEARRVLGGPTQRFALPPVDGHITGLLIRVDGLQNRRGPVPRATLTSFERSALDQAKINVIFGGLAGILAGILFYNLTLYAVLRHRVLAAFCWPIIGTLFYGIVWSNAILWFFPNMTTATQFGWNALAITTCFAATANYFRAFIEPGLVSEWAHTQIMRLSMFTMAVCIARLLPLTDAIPWRMIDALLYIALFGMVALLVYNCGVAFSRRSRAVRFFLFAWSLPVIIAFSRILWGVGTIRVESALFDATSFVAMSVQAMLSAVALSWRFRQMQDERDEARNLAEIDPLSGLLNRRALLAAVAEDASDKELVLVDIDHFKQINDRYGHGVGDDVIVAISRILRNFSPDDAIVGRLGGEEFAVIITAGADKSLAERLCRVVARAEILPDREKVTISAGTATGMIASDADWHRLYTAADTALYDAKRTGRNRVQAAAAA